MPKQLPRSFEAEVRDTVVKSGLTGVAASLLAVTIFSPAGFGGIVGTSLASGFGLDAGARADENVYASLPAYPAPLTPQELTEIRSKLASTTASLETTRAATEVKIEHMRALSLAEGVAGLPPLPRDARPVDAPVAQPLQRDENIELAELMFAHENF